MYNEIIGTAIVLSFFCDIKKLIFFFSVLYPQGFNCKIWELIFYQKNQFKVTFSAYQSQPFQIILDLL